MSDVFLAGPIDFQDISELADYRLRLKLAVEKAGFSAVDQYTEALDLITDENNTVDIPSVAANIDQLPDEPYLDAIREAVVATSMDRVLADPSVVPEHTDTEVLDRIVERDLELLKESDYLLAYLPEPSCGTMAEIMHAREWEIPTVIISDTPPHFVQYFGDFIRPDIVAATEVLLSLDAAD